MSDASAVQLFSSALGGGVVVGLLNVSVRLREFRREDRARWVADRRQAWSALLDHANHMLAECAPLQEIAKVASASGDADIMSRAKKVADEAYRHWIETQPHIGTLRLLAGKHALPALDALDDSLKTVAGTLIGVIVVATDPHGLNMEVASARRAMDAATEAARRDIGA